MTTDEKLRETFRDIIDGKIVKRSRHELIYDGKDVSGLFAKTLQEHLFLPLTVGESVIEPGQRLPAFYLERQTAYFGWVFWEKFSQLRLRKLFGTVIRNAKGDWLIQLPSNSSTIIYVNSTVVFEMDIDRPFEL